MQLLLDMINLQVRFIAAYNSGVYILRVERENLFTFDRIVLYTERSEQKNMILILYRERSQTVIENKLIICASHIQRCDLWI